MFKRPKLFFLFVLIVFAVIHASPSLFSIKRHQTFSKLIMSLRPFHDEKNLQGVFNVITYNVAGLPNVLSSSAPSKYIPMIGQRLSPYSFVFLQENFWYATELDKMMVHPYRIQPYFAKNRPYFTGLIGDGLSEYANLSLQHHSNIPWNDCNGIVDQSNDCLTSKGFSYSKAEIAPDIWIDIYNLHMDAGDSPQDLIARRKQVEQFISFFKHSSSNSAVIIGGDFNFHLESKKTSADKKVFNYLLENTGLKDSCDSLDCKVQKLDHILFRSNTTVDIAPLSWSIPQEFKDTTGQPLSDHEPVEVQFKYEVLSTPQ